VEYKRGRPKKGHEDEVQLCAQALCIEEMRGIKITSGALYYGKTRRRNPVVFDEALRTLTIETAARLHVLVNSGQTPKTEYEERRCKHCSLLDICMPQSAGKGKKVSAYVERMLGGEDE